MEEAIGSHIADYLIKPANPNQILLSLKKILDGSKLITEKAIVNYQQVFRNTKHVQNTKKLSTTNKPPPPFI